MRQRSGGTVILAISIVAGLLAALLSVSFLRGVAGTTPVLVAVQEIQPFTPLTPQMFSVQQLPGSAVPADAVVDLAALNGRYARTLLLKGTVVRQGHLAMASGDTGTVSARLTETAQPGTRALAIPIDNATGVGGTIQAGERVDIIAAVRIESTNSPATTFSKVIAQGVPVLHRTEPDNYTTTGTVVVQVTPEQAEEIAFAQLNGKIYLATNPYRTGAETEKTTGVTPDSFIRKHGGR